ncbi:HAMP domain-containing sensor histidine kinase [Paenibacillus roseipurpureus]|uniref:histidine kinase n=1 Tax=Paenibacillus roseopurpureus TaxID=2918901 RepID=A0AA96RKL1_9BACL|nr:HAMP domain-containing sensor histidine kinase [Paenibacillus sp. MBLB1832]WNR44870.1 HAMP domain-containing sensor histidine kinase [Paenibacillus sp. MBLB1832]
MTNKKRLTLLQVWSRTYLISMLIGIFIVGFIAVQWLQYVTRQDRIATVEHIAVRMAEQVVNSKGEFIATNEISAMLANLQRDLSFKNPIRAHIKSADQRIIFPTPEINDMQQGRQGGNQPPPNDLPPKIGQGAPQGDRGQPPNDGGPPRDGGGPNGERPRQGPPEEMFDGKLPQTTEYVKKRDTEGVSIYMVSSPIMQEEKIVGGVYLSLPEHDIADVDVNYAMLYTLLTGGGLLGWIVMYLLTRRLIKPIKEVADAAKQLMLGNYDVSFQSNSQEQEVAQLTATFQDMAGRLKQLESLRTLLIAGVTHELKTPVASISGLLQAVQDKVVEGAESEEFIQLSLKEAERMHNMVEDLLDFNGFATGALRVTNEPIELHRFVREVVYQWRIAQEEQQQLDIQVESTREELDVMGDTGRIQQILINLLNNSLHAGANRGGLRISLYDYSDREIGIDVADQGKGIPPEEQPYIFERFYRGQGKKHKVRGLGLGLPYSLMLAHAQRGQLFLRESSPSGSIFTLTLLKIDAS